MASGIGTLFKNNRALLKSELRKLTQRDSFSKYLPYLAYSPEERTYINHDDTTGFIWECTPLVYASEKPFLILEGLFNSGIPEGSVMQFTLYADPYINFITDRYAALKNTENKLVHRATESVRDLFLQGTDGIKSLSGIPARNFRLIVSLKVPAGLKKNAKEILDTRDSVFEILKGAGLNPYPVNPEELINTLAKIINDDPPEWIAYDDERPINKQIIFSETEINSRWTHMQMGERIFKCLTPKKLPPEANPMTMNILCGDIWGLASDPAQINAPFIYSVNFIFEKLHAKLHSKCNMILQQEAVGSFAPSLRRKQEEYVWATGEIEKGTPFIRVMPIAWIISKNEAQARENHARLKRIWESQGFVTQEDKGILKILFLSSLPLGLINQNKNVDFIDRDFIVHSKAATRLLPIQADFAGGGDPKMLFLGRKGQVVTFDLFSRTANNHNAVIAAASGTGKSFLTNFICYNYSASNSIIRIIDIGGGYKKICNILGGRFVTFTKDSDIVLNPFTHVKDIAEEIQSISSIIAQMVYSSSQHKPDETETTIIKNAIRAAYSIKGNETDIDDIYEHLKDPGKMGEVLAEVACSESECIADIKSTSAHLAYNLRSFTSAGEFGRWFNGPATLYIGNDRFVVLELEELKKQQELFNVVTLQILNYVTSNLYLSDRRDERLIIFDEAWQFFTESSMLKNIIEEGYRKARKYGGSFTTIVQSLLDLKKFGGIGEVIKSNSAFRFYLESDDFDMAGHKKIIETDDFTLRLMKSLSTQKPRYSEIYMETPFGTGVARLVVSQYLYYLFTSDPRDNAIIEDLVSQGKDYDEAILLAVKLKNGGEI